MRENEDQPKLLMKTFKDHLVLIVSKALEIIIPFNAGLKVSPFLRTLWEREGIVIIFK